MTNGKPAAQYMTLDNWFKANQDKSPQWFAEQMEPKVTRQAVMKWRAGSAMPRKKYIAQIDKLTGGLVTAATYYF